MADLMAAMVLVEYKCPDPKAPGQSQRIDVIEDDLWVWKSDPDSGGFISTKVYAEIAKCNRCGSAHTVRLC